MIREVRQEDAAAIAAINNHYVMHSDASFDTEPTDGETMRQRIATIAAACPYFVCEEEGEVVGYCFAHPWKARPAYGLTLETTVYLAPGHTGKGIGRALMLQLIEACRRRGIHVLIACITGGNRASTALHEALGFQAVSHFREVGRKFGRWLDVVDYELIL